jgi:hypothetical protein
MKRILRKLLDDSLPNFFGLSGDGFNIDNELLFFQNCEKAAPMVLNNRPPHPMQRAGALLPASER